MLKSLDIYEYAAINLNDVTCLRSPAARLLTLTSPDSEVHAANMGPTWVLPAQMGPMLAPWTLLSGSPKSAKEHQWAASMVIFFRELSRWLVILLHKGAVQCMWVNQILCLYTLFKHMLFSLAANSGRAKMIKGLRKYQTYQRKHKLWYICIP